MIVKTLKDSIESGIAMAKCLKNGTTITKDEIIYILENMMPIPEADKQIKIGGYQTLALRIEEMQKKIMFLEQDRGHRVKLLEQQVKTLKDNSHRHNDESDCVYPFNPDWLLKKDAPAVCTCPDDPEPHKHHVPPSATEGQGIEDSSFEGNLFEQWCDECKGIDKNNIRHLIHYQVMPLLRSHGLPKDKILVDRGVSQAFVDEMLAQAKYAKLSGKNLVDLVNELRKALNKEKN